MPPADGPPRDAPAAPFPVAVAAPTASPGPLTRPTPAPLWWVLRTKGRQEKVLAEDLQRMAIPYFLPLQRVARYYGKRKLIVDLPLFAGYCFLQGDRDAAFTADRTGHVAQIIEVPDQHRLDRELAALRLALQSGLVLERCQPLQRGTQVQVRSGPLRGIRGVVDRQGRDDRLVLGVELIGEAAFLEIEQSLLEVVENTDTGVDDSLPAVFPRSDSETSEPADPGRRVQPQSDHGLRLVKKSG
ncbi:MAG: UpxY family transcription antiterminator [Phycisphaerales bacterium]|nr:UpxY family transcription antiterminator [Phycisphaerales bacterium]